MSPRTPHTRMVAACAQIDCRIFDPESNRERAQRAISAAAARGARLVLLPEYLTTGCVYDRRLSDFAEPIGGTTHTWMQHASRASGCWIGAGMIERDGRRIHNTLLLTGPTGQFTVYRKRHLPFFEKLYFHRGQTVGIAETEIGRVGLMICWDMVHNDLVREMRNEIDLLLISSAWPDLTTGNIPLGPFQRWISRQASDRPRQLARELNVPVLFCNMTGPWNTRIPGTFLTYKSRYAGASAIIGPQGEPLVSAIDGEDVIVGEFATPLSEFALTA